MILFNLLFNIIYADTIIIQPNTDIEIIEGKLDLFFDNEAHNWASLLKSYPNHKEYSIIPSYENKKFESNYLNNTLYWKYKRNMNLLKDTVIRYKGKTYKLKSNFIGAIFKSGQFSVDNETTPYEVYTVVKKEFKLKTDKSNSFTFKGRNMVRLPCDSTKPIKIDFDGNKYSIAEDSLISPYTMHLAVSSRSNPTVNPSPKRKHFFLDVVPSDLKFTKNLTESDEMFLFYEKNLLSMFDYIDYTSEHFNVKLNQNIILHLAENSIVSCFCQIDAEEYTLPSKSDEKTREKIKDKKDTKQEDKGDQKDGFLKKYKYIIILCIAISFILLAIAIIFYFKISRNKNGNLNLNHYTVATKI